MAHHGRGGDIPAGLPGRRARKRRPLCRRIDNAPAADLQAPRDRRQRQARRGSRSSMRVSASPARSTRPRPPARSSSAIAASTPGSTRASRSSAPAAWAWSSPTSRPTRSTATTTRSRRRTSRISDGAAVKAYITSTGAAATAKIVPLTAAELAARSAGPGDHRFLVTRSVDDDRRRHPQAGHRGSGQRRDRGGRPAEQPRPDLGLHVGHVHVLATHRRHRPAVQGEAPGSGSHPRSSRR